jgi:outer membrane autotransporter protein
VPDLPRAARLRGRRTYAHGAAALALLLHAASAGPAFAQSGTPIVVTTTLDNDKALPTAMTLRRAVGLANSSGRTITFALVRGPGLPVGPGDNTIVLSDVDGDGKLVPITVLRSIELDASRATDTSIQGETENGTVLETATLFEVGSTTGTNGLQLKLVDLATVKGSIEIADANELSFDVDGMNNFTVDLSTDTNIKNLAEAPMSSGGLRKMGSGTLLLTGRNTYSGGTTIEEGTLIGDFLSLGSGGIDVADGAALIFEAELDSPYAGDLDGTGLIVKTGSDRLVLSGGGNFSGDLAIDNGTVVASATALPGAPVVLIAAEGTFELDETGGGPDPTFGGAIESNSPGVGTLRIMGTPLTILTLTGEGDFTGTTIIEDDAGILKDRGGTIRGDVELGANTALHYDISKDVTNSGRITGDGGSVVKEGPGTVTLLGANDYGKPDGVPDTRIEDGTLRGNTTSLKNDFLVTRTDPDKAGTLEFNQESDGEFTGTIDGTGAVRKSGSGTLVFPNTLTYTGPTSISAGQLVVNATLASPTTVEAAGVLGGTGAIAAPVTVRGTVSPSQKSTPLNVQSIEFRPGSVLEIDIDSVGAADRVTSTSTASCKRGNGTVCDDDDPAIVRVRLGQGDFSAGTTATILDAGSNIEGTFFAPPQFAFLGTTVDVDPMNPNELKLTIGPRYCDPPANTRLCEFSDWAVTPNQTSVADALDEADPAPVGSDMETVIAELKKLPVPELPPSYDAIGGESISGFTTTRLAMGERLERTLHRRMRDVAWGGNEALSVVDAATPVLPGVGGSTLAFAPGVGSALYPGLWASTQTGRMGSAATFDPEEGGPGLGGWLDAWGIFGSLDGDGNSAGVDYTLAGTTLGVDYRPTDHWIAGLAAGYAYTTFDLDGRKTNSQAHNAQAALYGGYIAPRFYVGASARYAFGSNESERRIAFGSIDRIATGDFDSHDFGARIEAGANVVRFGTATLQPLAAFDWSQLGQDGFRETGAGALDLDVDSENTTSLLSSFGARLHGRVEIDEETSMVPELRAMWLHEFGDLDRIVRGRLTGAVTGGDFRVRGAESPRDSALVGLGWSATIGDAVLVFADYDAIIDSRRLEHNIALTVRVRF